MKNPALNSPGAPSAEISANVEAHRKRVAAEEAMSSAQRHAVGDRVEVRDLNGADWHVATVLSAWGTGHYGWVYRVRFASGIEWKVTGQRVRAHTRLSTRRFR